MSIAEVHNASVIPGRIAAAGINSVMVVDDAFDDLKAAELQEELQEFWEPFIRDDEATEELHNDLHRFVESARAAKYLDEESTIEDWTELTDDLLGYLFEQPNDYPALADRANRTIFASKLEKLAPVRELCNHIHSLSIKLTTHSSDVNLSEKSARLIFLDYYLGAADDETAIEQAKARIKEIYASVPDGEQKPFVVLMSSKEVGSVQRQFCNETGLLLGLLTFAPKNELRNRELLVFHLATWAFHLPQRHAIQSFVESLELSLEVAAKAFTQRIRGLGIEDYANIQWLSLQDEGQPLGDYMLWLYKAMLSHLLHDNAQVLKQQQQLDEMTVDNFLPNHAPPSSDLAELYGFALSIPGVGPAGRHPRSGEADTDLHLGLGDLFFRSTLAENDEELREVLIVLNAACDLAYSPNSERSFPSERYVLFNYGRLQPIQNDPVDASMTTQPFLHPDDGSVYRINWNHQKAVWKQYGECEHWLKAEKYDRRMRMALPYALELQKSFANYITRIGMPVQPPIARWRSVAVCCAMADKTWAELEIVKNGVQLIRKRSGENEYPEQFVLSKSAIAALVQCADRVQDGFDQREADYREELEAVKKRLDEGEGERSDNIRQIKIVEGKLTGLENQRMKIHLIAESPEQWLDPVEVPRSLPPRGSHVEIDAKMFWVYLAADYGSNFPNGPPILLNIIDHAAAEATQTQEPK